MDQEVVEGAMNGRKKYVLALVLLIVLIETLFIHGEQIVNETDDNFPTFDRLFSTTKLLCFGRYAIEVPKESDMLWGLVSFPSKISVVSSSHKAIKGYMDEDVDRIMDANDTAEVVFSGLSPMGIGWQLDYYEGKYEKRDGALFSRNYIELDENIYFLTAAKRHDESKESFLTRLFERANSLRTRAPNEVPTSPGYCIEHGFMKNDRYDSQEIVAAGLSLPSFPDVTFSVTSNKNAYGDYSLAEFDSHLRGKLSLLSRIKQAKEEQGSHYPKRTILREGDRTVQHWKGEESLIRRTDGTHDFEWAFVGRPKDVANPSEFSVQMFTKVAHNTVGAAEKSSLTDDEAIALWDKLLSGLKFRVKVPGAPEGSYYFLPGADTKSGAKP